MMCALRIITGHQSNQSTRYGNHWKDQIFTLHKYKILNFQKMHHKPPLPKLGHTVVPARLFYNGSN